MGGLTGAEFIQKRRKENAPVPEKPTPPVKGPGT